MFLTDSSITSPLETPDQGTPVLDASFAAIDWQVPWVSHLNQLGSVSQAIQAFSAAYPSAHETQDQPPSDIIAEVLNQARHQQSQDAQTALPSTNPTAEHQAHTLQFVSQNALPEGEAYERFIASTGSIPTRDNLHDLFNGCIWLTFPQTKALLNHYHMLEIAEQGISDSRGRVRDTITVFDENGAILVTAKPEIGEALRHFDWQNALVAPRDEWDDITQPRADATAAVYIFGHALLEQLIEPRKPLCAHSVIINVDADFFKLNTSDRMAYLDHTLAKKMDNLLSEDTVTPRQLSPLPVLGVPHFWAANANRCFYEDDYVFRSGRRRKNQG